MVTNKNTKLSASLEDYLEAIFNLASKADAVRSKDIAELLGVSRSSVTGALRALKQRGLVNYAPYDYVTLTKSGQVEAAEVVKKHNILKSFFINVLGVDTDIAQQAACKAEHGLGPSVISRLLHFIEFTTKRNRNGQDVARQFQKFCKSRIKEKALR